MKDLVDNVPDLTVKFMPLEYLTKKNVPDLTVKSMRNTRWESWVKSVKAIRFQTPQIRLALLELYNYGGDDVKAKSEAESLANSLETFQVLLIMVIWYEILFAINVVSKKLQSKSTCIEVTMKEVEGMMLYFEKYTNEGFDYRHNAWILPKALHLIWV